MLESYRYYNDLIAEIDILEYQLETCIAERENWNFFGGRFSRGVPLDIAAEKMDKLSERIEWITERLDRKKDIRSNLERRLSELEALDYKVAFMRIVEGKKLYEIAEELDLSEDWIKKVSARVTRHLESTDILEIS